MNRTDSLPAAITRVCRRLDALGFTPGAAGNISARVDAQTILISPTGSVLAELKPRAFVRVALDGRFPPRGGKPSVELGLHAAIYRLRPDVQAIIHAHPPVSVGFAIARQDFGRPCNIEIYATMGMPALIPFTPPGEVHRAFPRLLRKADAFFMASHGVIVLGGSLRQALHRIEAMENFAIATVSARALGGAAPLSAAEMQGVHRFMRRAGVPFPRGANVRK